jgi:hypothetical protein
MWRTLVVAILGTVLSAGGMLSAGEKTGIKDGIEGHVKSVDVAKKTLTIITSDGKSARSK